MRREEIQIVRRRLDDYTSYTALAQEADRQAIHTGMLIAEAGRPKSPQWDKIAPTETHVETASIINELISEEQEFNQEAAKWRHRKEAIEAYIRDNYSGKAQEIMVQHYQDGLAYEDLEEIHGISSTGLKSIVYRAMRDVEFEQAAELI